MQFIGAEGEEDCAAVPFELGDAHGGKLEHGFSDRGTADAEHLGCGDLGEALSTLEAA